MSERNAFILANGPLRGIVWHIRDHESRMKLPRFHTRRTQNGFGPSRGRRLSHFAPALRAPHVLGRHTHDLGNHWDGQPGILGSRDTTAPCVATIHKAERYSPRISSQAFCAT